MRLLYYINSGALILDVRIPNDFEKGFINGAINGKMGMFAPWVGTIISPSSKIVLVCNKSEEKEVISRLARIGYENVIGYISDLTHWEQNRALDYIKSIDSTKIDCHKNNALILDVRREDELKLGFVKDSIHIPLSQLSDNLDKNKNIRKFNDLLCWWISFYDCIIYFTI